MKFQEAVLEIKRRIDISQTIGRYIKLKKAGSSLVGLCPFHDEKSPSFHVKVDKGYFKCFGCDESGDVFSFLEKKTGQHFSDLVVQLAGEAGVELDWQQTKESSEASKKKKLLFDCLKKTQHFYSQQLFSEGTNFPPLNYLVRNRRLVQSDILDWKFGFGGYDHSRFIQFLKKEGISNDTAIGAGVLTESNGEYFSVFKNRVTIPILNHLGHLVGFGGRLYQVDNSGNLPKYVNSRATLIYDKSSVLFGLFESLPVLKKKSSFVLTEGYFDVLAVQSTGFAAGAACGTSFTKQHIDLLGRYASEIILCLDQDMPGQKAQLKVLPLLLAAGFQVKVAKLPQNDPDTYLKKAGKEALASSLLNAPDAVEVLIRKAKEKSKKGVSERIAALKSLFPYLRASKSGLVRRQYVRLAAIELEEDESLILRELGESTQHSLKKPSPKITREIPQRVPIQALSPRSVPWAHSDKMILRALLAQPIVTLNGALKDLDIHAELQEFMDQLRVEAQKSEFMELKKKAFSLVVSANSTIARIRSEMIQYTDWLSENDAENLLDELIKAKQKRQGRAAFDHTKQELAATGGKEDLDKIRTILTEQEKVIKSYFQIAEIKKVEPKPDSKLVFESKMPIENNNSEVRMHSTKKPGPEFEEIEEDWT